MSFVSFQDLGIVESKWGCQVKNENVQLETKEFLSTEANEDRMNGDRCPKKILQHKQIGFRNMESSKKG